MTENKRYKFKKESLNDFDEYGLESPILLEEDVLTFGEVIDKLNEQEETIQRLELIINGLTYALKNIKKIDVEIDLNECGDA